MHSRKVSVFSGFLPLLLATSAICQTVHVVQGSGSSGQPSPTPISNASVYVFETGTHGPNTAPFSLIPCGSSGVAGPDNLGNCYVQTDSNGIADITNLYYDQCNDDTSLVYLMSIGGDFGQGANSQAILVSPMPLDCNDLQGASDLYISDITTVAASFTLVPFVNTTAVAADGFATKNASTPALAAAFQASNALVSGLSNNFVISDNTTKATINTIADVVDQCVNSSGSASTGCSSLFLDTNFYILPIDSYQATLSIAQAPANNSGVLFEAATMNSPWQPILPSVPLNWALPIPGGPIITAINNSGSVAPGSTQTIQGVYLMSGSTRPIVVVNGLQATVTGSPTSNQVQFIMPSGALSSGFVGVYTGGYASNFIAFGLNFQGCSGCSAQTQ